MLGTAQLGIVHGVNNHVGPPDPLVAKGIIEEAYRQGITEFDTAQDYGPSESILGAAFTALGIIDKVKVFTKLNPAIDIRQPAEIAKAVHSSLECLRVKSLSALMLHRQEQLSVWNAQIYPSLLPMQKEGLVSRFGVSVYTPQAAREALETKGIDCVQIPSNILDQRFGRAGIFDLAKARGKEVYVRSVYLQGLLLMDESRIPEGIKFAAPFVRQVKALAQQYNVAMDELCLGYVLAKWPDSKVVVGAESIQQVARNGKIARQQLPQALLSNAEILFTNVDERVVNLLMWPWGTPGLMRKG